MTAAIYHRKMARALDQMGGLYTVNDLLTEIAEGRLQSFAVNNTWAITQVQNYPRRRQLAFIAAVGDLADRDVLHEKVLDYARREGADLVAAHGRMGWMPHAEQLGWTVKARSYLYQREL